MCTLHLYIRAFRTLTMFRPLRALPMLYGYGNQLVLRLELWPIITMIHNTDLPFLGFSCWHK